MSRSSELTTSILNLRKAYTGMTPLQINNGCCYDFAKKLSFEVNVPIQLEYFGNPTSSHVLHVWVSYDGKYYDAETPHGVEERRELPVFVRNNIEEITEDKLQRIDM